MKQDVVWTWAAEMDAQEAYARMEEAAEGSGERFVRLTDRMVSLLQAFPFVAAVWRRPVRRALIRRTHYGLFYVVEPARLVVIGLQDLRSDPERLERELLRRLP